MSDVDRARPEEHALQAHLLENPGVAGERDSVARGLPQQLAEGDVHGGPLLEEHRRIVVDHFHRELARRLALGDDVPDPFDDCRSVGAGKEPDSHVHYAALRDDVDGRPPRDPGHVEHRKRNRRKEATGVAPLALERLGEPGDGLDDAGRRFDRVGPEMGRAAVGRFSADGDPHGEVALVHPDRPQRCRFAHDDARGQDALGGPGLGQPLRSQ